MMKSLKLLLCFVIGLLLVLFSQGVAAVLAQAPANHAPVLDNSGNPALNSIAEEAFDNPGTTISATIATVLPLDMITDTDPGALEGLAIIAVDDENGRWEYSIDGGSIWTEVGLPSPAAARLLASDDNTRLRFVPLPNFNGPLEAAITFRAWDQTGGSNGGTADTTTNGGETAFSTAIETASITVAPTNDPPEAVDDTANTPTNTPRIINALNNDFDIDGDSLSLVSVSAPANGAAAPNLDGTVAYTPSLGFTSLDVFSYTIADTGGLTDTATITVTVGMTNSAPSAFDDVATTFEEIPVSIAVLNNDSDPDGDTLTVIAVGSPANGNAGMDGIAVVYTPNPGFIGDDSFAYTISDGALTVTATVTVKVRSLGTNVWEEDHFDELVSGPLHGQNGWVKAAPYRASPLVVADGGGKVLKIDAAPGTTIVMLKDVPDQSSGRHTFVVRAKVTDSPDPARPTLAKIEVRTDPSTGWTKKFQLYFGDHFRVNYSPNGAAKLILSAAELQENQWYHIRGEMDLDNDLLDVWVDGQLKASNIPMHPGPITELGMSGWDRPGAVFLDDIVGLETNEEPSPPLEPCHWINSAGGLWAEPTNWSTNKIPDATCHAFITLDGTYTVTLNGIRTVGGLTLGGTMGEQTLWIQGNATAGHALLRVNRTLSNTGVIRLESQSGIDRSSDLTIAYSGTLANSGTLTNTGTIEVNQGAGGSRKISGNIINQGKVNVNTDLTYGVFHFNIPATFTNQGNVTIAAGQEMLLPNPKATFNQEAGMLAGEGVLKLSQATLNFNGGTISNASTELTNAKLNIGPTATGTANFSFIGNNNDWQGDSHPGQTLWLKDSTEVRVIEGTTNGGLIRMESEGGNTRTKLIINGEVMTNTGIIEVNQGSGGAREIWGSVINQGEVNINTDLTLTTVSFAIPMTFTNQSSVTIATGHVLSIPGAQRTVNQEAGMITGEGVLKLSLGTFNFNGGTLSGSPVELMGAKLNIGPDATDTANFTFFGNSELHGNTHASQVLWLRQSTTLKIPNGATNGGLIRMESKGSSGTIDLQMTNDSLLTNTGVISISLGDGGLRRIWGNVLNQGAVEVNTNLHYNFSIGNSDTTFTNQDTLTIAPDQTFIADSNTTIENALGGLIQGAGTLNVSNTTASFTNTGEIKPGMPNNPVGLLTIAGNFPQTPSGALSIDIGGTTAGSGFDQLQVSGLATLTGTLNISLTNSFTPTLGDSFEILTCNPCSGTFDVINGWEIGNGKRFEAIYSDTNVTLEVVESAGNTPPTALNDIATTLEDMAVTITVLANDTDLDGDTLTVTAVATPTNGAASSDGTTVVYTPTLNFNGTDVFSYTISDTSNLTGTATVTVTISPVNDPPGFTLAGTEIVLLEDGMPSPPPNWATNISAGPADESGQSLTFTLTNDNPTLFANQPALTSGGMLTFQPASNAGGSSVITVTLTDDGGALDGGADTSPPQTFIISVTPINDAPVLDNSGQPGLTAINENETNSAGTLVSAIIASGASSDPITDVDNGAVEGLAVTAVNNSNGDWQFSTDGGNTWMTFGMPTGYAAQLLAADDSTQIRFVPDPGFNGVVDPGITFRAWDQTSGSNGGVADTTLNGGTTAFSAAIETASITVVAASGEAIIHIDPPTTTIPLGVTGFLTVTVTPQSAQVNGVQIHGQVDPNHLRLVDVQPTAALPTELDPISFDPTTGEFRYGAGLLNGVITEPFDILILEVEAVATTTISGTLVEFLSSFPPTDVSGPGGSVLAESQAGLVIITPAATLQASVDLQGRPADKNDPSWALPLTVTLTSVDSGVSQIFSPITDQSVFALTGIEPGRYDIQVKGHHTLRNLAQNVDLIVGQNPYFLSTLLEGDVEIVDTFNQVVLADFGLLSGSFNQCSANAGFVANADLDESGCVVLADFGLLSGNFNLQGDIVVTASAGPPPPLLTTNAAQANLAFAVDQMAVEVDQVTPLTLEIDPNGTEVNGSMVHLSFDPNLIEVVDVELTEALPTILLKPLIDNEQGLVQFAAGALGQTLSDKFSLATLSVKVKATTTGTTITPVVDTFPATDISGPTGSILGDVKGVTLATKSGGQPEHTIFLPFITK